MINSSVVPLSHAQFSFAPWDWPFAQDRRGEIDAHFAARRVQTPDLWNGRVLLLRKYALERTSLSGTFFETDFASFLAWRDWGFPDADTCNCFAMGAIRATDGAYLLGVMAPHTANAGRIYFPAGTPDPGDIVGANVDLEGSVIREVAEETGLGVDDFEQQSGWTVVISGPRLALIKRLTASGSAAELRRRVLGHLKREIKPELSDIRIVAGRADFHPDMPAFVTAFLMHEWSE